MNNFYLKKYKITTRLLVTAFALLSICMALLSISLFLLPASVSQISYDNGMYFFAFTSQLTDPTWILFIIIQAIFVLKIIFISFLIIYTIYLTTAKQWRSNILLVNNEQLTRDLLLLNTIFLLFLSILSIITTVSAVVTIGGKHIFTIAIFYMLLLLILNLYIRSKLEYNYFKSNYINIRKQQLIKTILSIIIICSLSLILNFFSLGFIVYIALVLNSIFMVRHVKSH